VEKASAVGVVEKASAVGEYF